MTPRRGLFSQEFTTLLGFGSYRVTTCFTKASYYYVVIHSSLRYSLTRWLVVPCARAAWLIHITVEFDRGCCVEHIPKLTLGLLAGIFCVSLSPLSVAVDPNSNVISNSSAVHSNSDCR